ncbi:elongation factor P [Aurantiacibacter suaedae]|uniref:elongation factor P n=1 Tax=Aurantiacibacter suaedae TaxID=2545755 RepID=UPI0010F89C1B|nr:elongation factor P [Aurantiacibacter suaedae]
MHRTFITLALASAMLAGPALAQNGIGTMERGTYVCELPGDVRGAAGIAQPEANFTIISASRYSSPQGGGTYLRRGDVVRMTSGPRHGDAYRMISRNFLRLLDDDGTPGKLRCIRRGR